ESEHLVWSQGVTHEGIGRDDAGCACGCAGAEASGDGNGRFAGRGDLVGDGDAREAVCGAGGVDDEAGEAAVLRGIVVQGEGCVLRDGEGEAEAIEAGAKVGGGRGGADGDG